MRPVNVPADVVFAHVADQFDQGCFQFAGVVDSGEVAVLVMDDAVRRAFAVGLFNQQTIRSQLKDVRVIRRFGRTPRFDLYGDELSVLFDQVVGFAR